MKDLNRCGDCGVVFSSEEDCCYDYDGAKRCHEHCDIAVGRDR